MDDQTMSQRRKFMYDKDLSCCQIVEDCAIHDYERLSLTALTIQSGKIGFNVAIQSSILLFVLVIQNL